jgi:AcrR family transcriptional regulator
MSAPNEPAAPRQRSNSDLREEATGRMLTTAIRLIAEKGASKLSLVDVGRESGYSHSLPNYYFKTKTRLLLEVYRFISGSFQVRARALSKDRQARPIKPGLDSIESTIRSYLGLASSDPMRSQAMNVLWGESFSSMPALLQAVRPLNRRTLAMFAEQVRAGIRQGEIDPQIDAEAAAVLILALLRGGVGQHLLEPSRADLERLTETAVGFLRRGLAPQSEPQSDPPAVPQAALPPDHD